MIEVLRRLRLLWALIAIGLGVYTKIEFRVDGIVAVFFSLAMFLPMYLHWPLLITAGCTFFGLSGFAMFATQDIRFIILGASVFAALALLHWLLKPLWRRNS